jgi:hypothetical protein
MRGVSVYHQLGDPYRRVIWNKENGQTLTVEGHDNNKQKWRRLKQISTTDFSAKDASSEFVGNISESFRAATRKLNGPANIDGDYLFAPFEQSGAQILYSISGKKAHRVRVRLIGNDDAELFFEKLPPGCFEWEHRHHTTLSRFVGDGYRRGLPLEEMPNCPPKHGVFARVRELLFG